MKRCWRLLGGDIFLFSCLFFLSSLSWKYIQLKRIYFGLALQIMWVEVMISVSSSWPVVWPLILCLAKTLTLTLFGGYKYNPSQIFLTFCMMITSAKLYTNVVPRSLTMTWFEGHGGVRKVKLRVVLSHLVFIRWSSNFLYMTVAPMDKIVHTIIFMTLACM